MCCLFGLIDYGKKLPAKEKSKLLAVLARECEERGTDATGIAYNQGGRLRIYKRPWPASQMRFRVPERTAVLMGHTRMTTQGSAKKNRNNHPFRGCAGKTRFALAHNGVLYNDTQLRNTCRLPFTNIETDSFVAVQLLEQQNALTFSSLKAMAEKVEGTFCFTVLDQRNDLYLVKGNNPLCLYHYPDLGLYLYASTQAILARAVSRWKGRLGRAEQVKLLEGDILRINARGKLAWSRFQTDHLFPHRYPYRPLPDSSYLQSLRSYAGFCGYDRNEVDIWLQEGFTTDEIEDFLWCGTV